MTFCDSHIHFEQCRLSGLLKKPLFEGDSYFALSSAHDPGEFERMEGLINNLPANMKVFPTFGLHPQNPLIENADFLERLIREKRITAIGEAGFDFFTADFKASEKKQEDCWNVELELAEKYSLPVVIHVRKAMHKIFADSKRLSKIPSVIFHSFPGSLQDAKSLQKKGVNAFYSFGKPLLNGKKSALDCVKNLPDGKILLETDAPFQTLKGEEFTRPEEIQKVFLMAAQVRASDFANLAEIIKGNFFASLNFPVDQKTID